MTIFCEEGTSVLDNKNIFATTRNACLYLYNDELYKIYNSFKINREPILDALIKIDTLDDIGVLPKKKVITNFNRHGLKMKYLKNAITLNQFINDSKNFDIEIFINIMKTLSDNLKLVHNEKIKFTDLHHNNVLINSDNYPMYIDFDDCMVNNYSSNKISCISHYLHQISSKPLGFKEEVLRECNLDNEVLFIILLNTIYNTHIEKMDYNQFQIFIQNMSRDFADEFVKATESLKNRNNELHMFDYYVGDFLDSRKTRERILTKRRNFYQ